MKLIYNVKDRPPFSQVIVFAIQQLLAIMAATLVVPVIINGNGGSVQTADLSVEMGKDLWVVVSDAENATVLTASGGTVKIES